MSKIISPVKVMNFRSLPFWVSAVLHVTVLASLAVLTIKPPVFALDHGRNSAEVLLVETAPIPPAPRAAPPLAEETSSQPAETAVPTALPVLPVPVKTPALPGPSIAPSLAKKIDQPAKPTPRSSSDHGAIVEAKPDYLHNPPPLYPDFCREQKQEGMVVLQVVIDTEGRPDRVSVETSSGYKLLDQSALRAVQNWKFHPASVGNLSVRSQAIVPINFRLEN